ncbi:sensor histidine kinase [Dokdonella sp.]|uniref:sensor histidine kinase n=1 Tax=Dokdonella sp. TaxID=2291710 RepID=UPI0035277886
MSNALHASLLRIRARLVPDDLQLGWMPIFILGYLAFLFMPIVFDRSGQVVSGGMPLGILWPTLLSIAIFLPIYFMSYRCSGAAEVLCMLGMAAVGYCLIPINGFANTYIVFACAFAALINASLWHKFAWVLAMLAAFLIEIVLLDGPLFVVALTTIISVAVFFGNHFFVEASRRRAALKLSHDEVRRLAALAERERIGRDLHDLLGHTLSLIALKSELAGKLLDRDPAKAAREISEVTRVARDALSQVRRAVSGIRVAGLAAELASAKQLLESDGIAFNYSLGDVALQTEQETALALVVREALTNVQRHARARRAEVILDTVGGRVHLYVSDNGRGGKMEPGNGMRGMRERIEQLGGSLVVESSSGKGTRLKFELPAPELSDQTLQSATAQRPIALH